MPYETTKTSEYSYEEFKSSLLEVDRPDWKFDLVSMTRAPTSSLSQVVGDGAVPPLEAFLWSLICI